MKSFRVSALLILIALLSSCLSIRPGSVKSGLKYYESFFVGDEGIQYFIKPIELKSSTSDEKVLIDFVFRHKDSLNNPVIINYSLTGNELIKKIKRVELSNGEIKIILDNNKFLFNEKNGEQYLSRFSTSSNLEDLKALFKISDWNIKIDTQSQDSWQNYSSNKQAMKAINKLYENLFVIL